MKAFRKPETIPLLFIIAATLTLGGLGTWQVERLMWKNALIADIASAQSQPPLTSLESEPYRRVELDGRFVGNAPLRVVGRPQWEQGTGYYLYYPFKTREGKTVMVRVGWAPSDWKGSVSGLRHVSGILRPAHAKRLFAPDNRPEKNVWFDEDTAAMGKTLGLAVESMVVEVTGEKKPGVYPTPSDGKIPLRNDHLGYAITWYSVMLIGLIMFALYHRVPEKKA